MLTTLNTVFKSFFEKSTLKYLLVGFFTVAIDYAAIYLFYSVLELYYVIAIVMGFVLSNVFQFFTNFFYTFNLEKNDQMRKRAFMYLLSAIIGMILGTLVVIFLEGFINSLYLSKTLSLVVSFLYGFIASKYIVFNLNMRF